MNKVMKLKITCFIVLFLMVSVSLLKTDNVSFPESLEDEETSNEVILSLSSTNIPGFQEGSIFTDTTLSPGGYHACAILDDGTVSCWGGNSAGQLGDGTTTNRSTPTQTSSFGTGRTAVAISSGFSHTCAVLDDGSVSCWGNNSVGQLGDGTTTNRNIPTQTSNLGTGRTAVAISIGTRHTCAILDNASVSCWGANYYGELGDGTTIDRSTPAQISSLGTGRTAVAISSGGSRTCAVLDDGTVSCWGRNLYGGLGDGTTIDRATPAQTSSLGTGRTAVAISSGASHTCALLDDATVSCWGDNWYGQLGDGTNNQRNTPTPTSSLGENRGAVAISSGYGHTCAILDDASVSCWGKNLYGQLGDGTNTNRNTPTQTSSLGTGRTAVAISSGLHFSCAILDNASVRCWGDNSVGQLGDGTGGDLTENYNRSTPTQTSSFGTTTNPRTVALSERDFDGDGILNIFDIHRNLDYSGITISSGSMHTCAILDDGSVSCWGDNGQGQLGDGTTTSRNTSAPTSSLGTGRTAVAISSGSSHTCAILDNGSVSCWGFNNVGQGGALNPNRRTPTQTSSLGTGRTAVAISSGNEHTCAILDDGTVSCWGSNEWGQLGDGTNYRRNTPNQTSSLGTGRTAVAISSGNYHTCAILDDGTVSCWGNNPGGQLGDGTNTDQYTPTQTSSLGTGRTAVAITAGYSHTCALLDDSSVSCWGYNGDGQLGDGTNTDRGPSNQTSSLGTGRTAVAISSGASHTCALLDDGTVSCWGGNYVGQLGDGTGGNVSQNNNRNTPNQTSSFGTGRTAVAISSTIGGHTCAILDDASVSCWGDNWYGQLGDGTNTNRDTPTQTSSLGTNRGAVVISSGYRYTCVILNDTSVSCWGKNTFGQLGDGTNTDRGTPTQISSLGTGRTAVAISSGGGHTCAILDDGTVSCWGYNHEGQLGDGTTIDRNTPTQTASLGTGRTAVAISSGDYNTCALLDDGTVSCWGSNDNGELGDGTNTNRSTPLPTSSLGTNRGAVAISSGGVHTCAVLDDGSVSCWGWNNYGQLGDGTITDRSTPTQTSSLGTGRTAVAISSGGIQTCAVLDDASVSCWGDNWYGELGDGTTTQRNTPTPTSSLGTGRTAVAISSGYGHACAVLDNASVSCWGYNAYGQIGDGTTTNRNTPTQTSSLGIGRTAVAISSGLHYSCAILDNASVSCWGANGDNRLGDGTNTDRSTPAQTASLGTTANQQTAFLVNGDRDSDGTLDDLDDFPNNSIRSIACTSGQYGRYLCIDSPAGKYVPSNSAMYATDCSAGTYQALTGQTSCNDADAGYYVATTSQTNQTACSEGTYQALTGQASCDDADAGYYVATTAQSNQIPCAIGTYQALTGQTSCGDADAGYYVPATAQSSQIPCSIGTYQALTGQVSCDNADPGHYVGQSGQLNQLECLAGTYQPDVGQSSCISASIGFYVLLDGAVEQTACPFQTSTKEIGSKLASDCVTDSDDDGTIDVDDAFPLDPTEDKDSDGNGKGDNIQKVDEANQMRMILIAVVFMLVIASVVGALLMRSGKKDTESDWHQEDSLFD